MFFWIWSVALIASLMLFFRERYSRFKVAGVNYLTPIPPLGNITRFSFRMEHFNYMFQRFYNAFPEDRFSGAFVVMHPIVIIRDLDLIKKITIKHFEYFMDHRGIFDEGAVNDDFVAKSLFSMRGSKWKAMRATLSPAFTSSKIRMMVQFMAEVGDQMNHALNNKIQSSGESYVDIDCRDLTTRYANDVIASCAYGIKINSHSDESNQFYKNGIALASAMDADVAQIIKFCGFFLFPKLMNILKVQFFSTPEADFFKRLLKNVMNEREEKHVVRHDMIHLLMEAKKGSLVYEDAPNEKVGFATVEESHIGRTKNTTVWSSDELIAQAQFFLLAGFDSEATVMHFLLYELAINPRVQETLAAEIRTHHNKNHGTFDFDTIQQMTYMDMVVSEILRMYNPIAIADRKCLKDYSLGRPNSKATKDYVVRKGEMVVIPTWSIHRDPRYYPDPDKFDPQRFSEENRHKIHPFSYMPFGLGPRNCIGMQIFNNPNGKSCDYIASRFALIELKVLVYQLLRVYQLSPNEATTVPFKMAGGAFHLRLQGGHSLRFSHRI